MKSWSGRSRKTRTRVQRITGEDEIIDWLRRQAGSSLIGDDAAVLPSESWAVTVDSQIEGVHFVSGLDPAILARRLLAVNLSDLAAMGARPRYGFLALAAPEGFDRRRFLRAILASARRYGLELAGGDLAKSRQTTAVLTVFGSRYKDGCWLRRGGAVVGETLWLGGCVGESAAGCTLIGRGAALVGRKVHLPKDFVASAATSAAARRAVKRHLQPQPQLALGQWLSSFHKGAAIDCSDGLARDLHRLCRESRVGATVDLAALPLARGFRLLSEAIGCNWQQLALGGGEDYVLLFTLPRGTEPPVALSCRAMGRICGGRKIELIEGDVKSALAPLGWDHLGG
jgi:thiamine-monophosphate kinase